MTRTAIRHALSALTAAAFVFVFAGTAMAGDASVQPSESVPKIIVTDPTTGTSANQPETKGLATKKQGTQNRDDLKSGYIGTHELGQKVLTAKKGSQPATTKQKEWRWFQDYGGGK